MRLSSVDLKQLRDRLEPELRAQGLEVGNFYQLVPRKEGVADDPWKILIETPRGDPQAILLQAPNAAPGIVRQVVERAREAERILGPGPGSAVLQPVASGEYGGLSYAVVPWQRPLTNSRWLWRLQRVLIAPRVLRWLTRAVEVSASELPDELITDRVARPLGRLVSDQRFTDAMRRDAEIALARLSESRWVPKTVVVHNDLWKGNILLPHGPDARQRAVFGFFLIDWGAAALPGFPFYDLARVCMSLVLPAPWSRRVTIRHCEILALEPVDAISSLLLAIADLGATLGHMPVDRYLRTANNVYRHFHYVVHGKLRAS